WVRDIDLVLSSYWQFARPIRYSTFIDAFKKERVSTWDVASTLNPIYDVILFLGFLTDHMQIHMNPLFPAGVKPVHMMGIWSEQAAKGPRSSRFELNLPTCAPAVPLPK